MWRIGCGQSEDCRDLQDPLARDHAHVLGLQAVERAGVPVTDVIEPQLTRV